MHDLQSLIQQIKNNINIVDVIGEYVKMENKGNNHTACCPFHKEDSPSFFISEDRQLYHCFGCGVGGDVFTFLQGMENMTFIESAKILAKRAHIPWQGFEKTDQQLRDKLLEINKLTAQFYHYVLLDLPVGRLGLQYLKEKRKMQDETIQKFLLGTAPDQSDILMKYLKKKGFSLKEMVEAGVVTQYESRTYDRFRGRIVFPIWNHLGQIVGFTGRILDDNKKAAKYLNTPQTLLFNKSSLVYGLFHAKDYLRTERKVILVEGQMDVIMAHQAGYKNVVAASGTSLTGDHLKLLKRYVDSIILCFDADTAGVKAMERGIELGWQMEARMKILKIPEDCGKDPDECIQKNKEKWEELIANPLTVWQYYSDKWSYAKSLEEKKDVQRDFFTLLSKIDDGIETEFWLQNFAQKFNVDLALLKEELEKFKKKNQQRDYGDSKVPELSNVKTEILNYEDHFLALFMHDLFLEKLEPVINFLSLESFDDDQNRELYKSLIIYYTSNDFEKNTHDFNEKFNKLLLALGSDWQEKIHYLALLFEKDYSDLTDIERKKHFISIIKKLKKIFVKKEIHNVKAELDKDDNQESFKRMQELLNDLNIINKYIF